MSNFNASTKEVLKALGLESSKSLFRRRSDYIDNSRGATHRFLEPNIHFRKKTPGSTQLVWDLERTVRAWATALKLSSKGAE